jgi:hydrogenase nickel incorporation protein HypB
VDLLPSGAIDFDIPKARQDACRLNSQLAIFVLSARTGEGLGPWCQWLKQSIECRA